MELFDKALVSQITLEMKAALEEIAKKYSMNIELNKASFYAEGPVNVSFKCSKVNLGGETITTSKEHAQADLIARMNFISFGEHFIGSHFTKGGKEDFTVVGVDTRRKKYTIKILLDSGKYLMCDPHFLQGATFTGEKRKEPFSVEDLQIRMLNEIEDFEEGHQYYYAIKRVSDFLCNDSDTEGVDALIDAVNEVDAFTKTHYAARIFPYVKRANYAKAIEILKD